MVPERSGGGGEVISGDHQSHPGKVEIAEADNVATPEVTRRVAMQGIQELESSAQRISTIR